VRLRQQRPQRLHVRVLLYSEPLIRGIAITSVAPFLPARGTWRILARALCDEVPNVGYQHIATEPCEQRVFAILAAARTQVIGVTVHRCPLRSPIYQDLRSALLRPWGACVAPKTFSPRLRNHFQEFF
jgi:hypothetical protein